MNYLLIALIAFIAATILILIAVYRTRTERNERITAAKDRANEARARSQPAELAREIKVEPSVTGLNVSIHETLTDEQAHILSKIFNDDSMYTTAPDHQWKTTEPSPLERE